MMDEPTSALDFGNQMRTIDLVKQLARQGYAVIIATHTPDRAIMLNGVAALMDQKSSLNVGSASEIMREETLRKANSANLRTVYAPEIGRLACLAENEPNEN